MSLPEVLIPYVALSLAPTAIALLRRKLIFSLQLAFVGLMISVAGWIWVLLFPNTVGMGIAYVLGPITTFGSPLFVLLALPFAVFYHPRKRTQTSYDE